MTKLLTIKQERFAQEYVICGDATEAYRIAYNAKNMSEETIRRKAYDVKNNGNVTARINELKNNAAEKAATTAGDVLKMLVQIATADANELIQVRRVSCTCCYGIIPSKNQAPDPDCTDCKGEGIEQIYITDTRKLSVNGKLLYRGARQTKNGIEIIMRDQDAALNILAKYFKILDETNGKSKESTDAILAAIKTTTDPIEASKIYQEFMMAD